MINDKIITEAINRFLVREFSDKKVSSKISSNVGDIVKDDVPKATPKQIKKVEKDTKSTTKNVLKDTGWSAVQQERNRLYTINNGRKIDDSSYSEAYKYLKAPTTNLAAVADELVDMGILNCKKGPSAQSYLRKMSEEEPAPSGGNYALRKNVVSGVLQIKSRTA